ncbi:MAG: NAD(P)H-dependent oxidoreductase [Pyrinomonadaceae bacterium]
MNLELPSNAALLQQLNWRYAVKKFDSTRKLSDEDWAALEQTLILTPTSYGLQPYKFVVITKQEIKEKIVPTAWGQTQARDCSHLVVIAGKKNLNEQDIDRYFERITEVRSVTRESQKDFHHVLSSFTQKLTEEEKVQEWAARQCYIALGFLIMAAAMRGIDSCPMEGFIPAAVDEVLDLESQDLTAVALCPIGYRAADDWLGELPKVRLTRQELVQII